MVKLTIGLPTYNCENIIENRIKQLLEQSFGDYILIISDNNSTDKTREICEKMAQNDERIIFFHHEQNRGPFWNFQFVLDKAETEYFVWAAGDDIWSNNFLEKNIDFLEKNHDYAGSIGESSLISRDDDKNGKVIKNSERFQYVCPVDNNDFNDRVNFYLKFNMGIQLYSIFRTEHIKFANFRRNKPNFGTWQGDFVTILKILKRGKLHVDIESYYYKEISEKSHSIIGYMKKLKFTRYEIFFSKIKFSTWFYREFGFKIFFKNWQYMTVLNLKWTIGIFSEVIRICKRTISGQSRYW